MSSGRKVIVDVLEQVLTKGAYSNIVLGAELNKSNLKDKDKGLVTEVVYGTLKYKYTIDKILSSYVKNGLNKVDSYVLNILRSAVYQMKYLDKIPDFAAVNEAVELAKKKVSVGASKFVNGVLRSYLRNEKSGSFKPKNKIEELSLEYSFEEWMVKLFIKQYGEEKTEQILKGLNKVPKITFRVNPLKCSYDEAENKLQELGYDIEEGYVCPEAVIINKGKNIESNPLFMEGLLTVQDESAMLVAPSMDLEDNLLVLDLCSAPGGKTTHISEIMNNTGKVKAFDIHKHKLSLIKNTADRLGITNIECDVMDASAYNESLADTADRVLIDVPCSGLGIIGKKPEIKWTKNMKQLKEISDIQRKIMINASKYVKVGGKILYSTCTLNREENNQNVKWFIENVPGYEIEALNYGNSDNIIYEEDGTVTILPNEAMDGFYIAKFIRVR